VGSPEGEFHSGESHSSMGSYQLERLEARIPPRTPPLSRLTRCV
jgi:hypothetical protein